MNNEHTFKGQMDLTFVKEEGRWYVDLPAFIETGAGTKDDLEMVAGADKLCDELSDGGNRLTVTISTSPFKGADFSIQRMNNGRTEGRDYDAYHKGHFIFTIWLCPVLLYVMGRYPEIVYFKKHESKQKTNNMKTQRTIYHLILDRSGSMSDCIENTVTGFNEQVNKIRQLEEKFPDQQIVMGLTTFNNQVEHHLKLAPPQSILTLTPRMYKPNGATALLDAIGLTTMMLEPEVDLKDNIDTTCVIVIITDGHENASKYYNLHSIRERITTLEATEKWIFSFIGATLDAVDVAETMNISRSNSLFFGKAAMQPDVWDKLSDSMDVYLTEKKSGEAHPKSFLKNK